MYGLWNTIALSDGTPATLESRFEKYYSYEAPQYALDQDSTTKHLNFGNCTFCERGVDCGINTGFYVTLQQGPTLLLAIQFTTANDDTERDPLSITIEGSNANSSALMRGTSWSLIYTMSTGLDVDPGREADGTPQCLRNNTVWHTSYRILVTSKRAFSSSVQYSGIKLFGLNNLSRTESKNSSASAI